MFAVFRKESVFREYFRKKDQEKGKEGVANPDT